MWSDNDSNDGISLQDQLLPVHRQEQKEERKISTKMILSLAGLLFLVALIILGLVFWSLKRADLPSINMQVLPVIILSIDGFRYSYLTEYASQAPNLLSIANSGFMAPLQPVFPSKTFPNHFSIATGLYPESHGIVSNTFYDPQFNETFAVRNAQQQTQSKWWGGEPFWITARKNNLNSAVHFWPGSEAAYGNLRPTYWSTYNQSSPNNDRVDQVLAWLSLPKESRPWLTAFYFDNVDTAGHQTGPDSTSVAEQIKKADDAFGRLLDGLKERGLRDQMNIIVVSDHGMTGISPQRVVMIDRYIDMAQVRVVDWSPVCAIIPTDETKTDELIANLSKAPHVRAYRKDQIPAPYLYENNRRITPIIIVADEGWTISSSQSFQPSYATGGAHGYDNRLPSMTAMMIGSGPAFKSGYNSSVIENVHVYSLLTALLDMKPAMTNGTEAAIDHLLLD
ncbi:phosphodiesterase I [Planoprotostelium fungivorum]|uniref:Phosphodiesterase I n=1 Tax=Planoprotostelium fungivorum TaxID=1890364 RepID=A0A2P6NHD6_9EUKA|nr:phosphodiesterase I [Planoprotostelium fungivorum]